MQLKENVIFDNRYQLEEFIGSGAYGEVWLAKDIQTDIEIAVKVYVSMDPQGLEDFKKEFKVSFELNHTNLLHANFLEISKDDKRPYLVMPFCPSGSVMKLLGTMSEEDIWRYIRDVASGLSYLHSQNPPIIHQDIKPDNILVSKNGEFVITDFGISQQARSTLCRSAKHLNSAGSMAYMGPERFGKQYNAIKASDIWSLGVTIFELATGDLPFCGLGGSMQRQGADMPDLPDNFSKELNAVMQSCMAKETWDRPTADVLAEYAAQRVLGNNPPISWLTSTDPVQIIEPDTDSDFDKTVIIGQSHDSDKTIDSQQTILKDVRDKDDSHDASAVDPKQTVKQTGGDDYVVSANVDDSTRRGIAWYVWLLSALVGLSIGFIVNYLNLI